MMNPFVQKHQQKILQDAEKGAEQYLTSLFKSKYSKNEQQPSHCEVKIKPVPNKDDQLFLSIYHSIPNIPAGVAMCDVMIETLALFTIEGKFLGFRPGHFYTNEMLEFCKFVESEKDKI